MTNFGAETISVLARHNYDIEDIEWIGCKYFEIPINEFFDVARKTEYNAGYGSIEMPGDLIISMKDQSYFERAEYDGSEWWRYVSKIKRPRMGVHLKVKTFKDVPSTSFSKFDPTLTDFVVKKGK